MIMLASGVAISGTGCLALIQCCGCCDEPSRDGKGSDGRDRPISDAMPDRAGNLLGCFPDQARPGALHAIGGRGDRKTRPDGPPVVPDPPAAAAHAELGLLLFHRVALAASPARLLFGRDPRWERVVGRSS